MRKHVYTLLFFALASSAFGQFKLSHRAPGDPSTVTPSVNVFDGQAVSSNLPDRVPTYFDPALLQYQESQHDKLLDNLATRVGQLETTSSWIKGGFAGVLLAAGLIMGWIRLFWRGTLTGVLNELNPRILKP